MKNLPLHQSIFYKVSSPEMLAKRLLIGRAELDDLLTDEDGYKNWVEKRTGRNIQEPRPPLRKVHKRVARQLANISTPEYLHSAIRGRSYLSNAIQHKTDHHTVKIDVRKFYPSARAQNVFHFFLDEMLCDEEVAGILTKLLTVNNHLPTGSSASPILSYFAYRGLFDAAYELALRSGCIMTVYIDDMVFSGEGASRALLYKLRTLLKQYRLRGHKTKLFRPGQPRVVTGVAMTKLGPRLPNRRQQKIEEDLELFDFLPDGRDKLVVARRLTGRLFEAAQIDAKWLPAARSLAAERDELERRFLTPAATHSVP